MWEDLRSQVFFSLQRLPQPRALRENNRDVVVVVIETTEMRKRKKGMWESQKLFSVIERASLPWCSLHIHDLRARKQ